MAGPAKIGQCKFCKRSGVRLVTAHIIPRSFFKVVRGKGKYSVGIQAKRGSVLTPFYQAGVADNSILCEECEPKFSAWDDYGFEVLSVSRGEADAIASSRDGTHLAIPIENLDYDIFSLFILSVLWRASVSKILFFREVDLGPYDDRIRETLWNNQPPQPVEYAILLGTSLDLKYKNVIVRPERCRVNHVLCQTIFFPNCFAQVKLDSRPAPRVVQLAMVQRRDVNYMFCFPYERSPYKRFFEGLMGVIRESRKTGLLK